jgi:VCBS repeat-containing protein
VAGISAPTDLLAQDTSYTSDTSGDTLTSDRSANGAKIWIENGQVKYDVSTLSGSFNTAVHHLGVGEHIDDSFTYAIRLANGTLSWNTVQVQWNGTNDAVQIGSTGTTGAISEQASATGSSTPDTTTGTVGFSDNDTSDTHTVTVVGSPTVTCSGGGVSADTMTALANALSIASTTDSTGTNQGSFAWNFNAADKTFDFLAQGETLTVTYNVQVDDHHGGAATTPVTITITGVNDPATITGVASGSVTDGGTLTASGALTVSDPDYGQSQAIAANGPTADGSYTVDANGNWSYTATEAAIQHLGAGVTATDSFTVTSLDGTASKTVNITITGINDPATISGDTTGGVTDGGTLMASGKLTVSDPDDGQSQAIAANGPTADGSYTVDANGNWSYTATEAAIQHLGAGVTATDSFTVTSLDGTASKTVNITITGINDPATISGDTTGGVTDGGTLMASGKLTVSDPDDGQSQAIAANGPTADGSYTVDANGNWSYTATEAAIQHLGAGVTATDSFTVTSLDGTASQPVTITIHGVNDAATISGVSAGNVTDGGQLTASGTLTVIDPDDGESHAQVVTNGSATDGSYTVDASGNWSYTANEAAIQHLGAGVTTTDSFTVTSLDGTATTPVTITIIGSNDPATISGTTSGTVVEAAAGNPGTPTVSSTLAVIDPDTGQNSFQAVATTSTASGYGSYAMTTGGTWTYTLDNANPTVDALNNGQPLSDSFTVNSQDGTPQTINITINGTTDDLGGPTGIALNLNPQAGDSLANLGTFVATGDPDPGDTFTYSVGAGSSSGFVVTGGVLDVTGVAAGNSTLNLVATDSANNSLTPQTYNVWIGTSHTDSKTFAIGSSNNIGTAQGGGDTVYGSNGTDYILGGSGNDTIQGNGGADFLVGGNGSDIFLYAAQSDSTLTTPDTILDFTTHSSTADEIDFKNALGLTTISTADFGAATTLAAHTVGWHSDGTNTAVYANLGGSSESITGGADMMKIVLSGVTDLGGGNIHIHA